MTTQTSSTVQLTLPTDPSLTQQGLSPSEILAAIKTYLKIGLVPFIKGPPGIGKTAVVNQAAEDLGYESVISLIGSQMGETDVMGAPAHQDGYTVNLPPKRIPRTGKHLLFLDEMPNARPSVICALQQLVNEKRAGDIYLSPESSVIAAGNCVEHRAGANKLNTAVGSRVVHLTMRSDLTDFRKWGCKIVDPAQQKSKIHPTLLAFLGWRPELFHTFDPKLEGQQPCPRTHEYFSTLLYELDENQLPDNVKRHMLDGISGKVFSGEYLYFENVKNSLISIDSILLNPLGVPISEKLEVIYATVSGISRRMTPANIGAAMQYLNRLPLEFQTMALMEASVRDVALQGTPAFTLWHSEHPEVTLG